VEKLDFPVRVSQRLTEVLFVVQLQTLHEISHQQKNFGELNGEPDAK